MHPQIKRFVKDPVIGLFSHRPLRRIIFWRVPRRHHKIALTFDDGPHPIYTPQTLDVLAKYGIRATFFVLGQMIERSPDVLRRMIDEGHEIGVHGYDHTHDGLGEQTLRTLDILADFGVSPTIFRPPGGRLSAETGLWMLRHRFSMVFWSFDGRDSMRHEGKDFYHRPYDELASGDILLLHDDNPVCVADTDTVAEILQRKHLGTALISEFLTAGWRDSLRS